MKLELKPEDSALFDAGREGLAPTSEDRARVAKALGLNLGGVAGVGSAAAKSLAGSGTSAAVAGLPPAIVAAKWITAVALVLGAGAGGVALYRAEAARRAPPPRASASAPVQVAIEEAPPPASLAIAAATPRPVEAAPARPAASSTSPRATRVEATPGVRVAEEARLLRRAEAALRDGDTSGATRWLDEHARLFPRGVLAEERDVQRVLVLCAAGQVDAARTEGSRFLGNYPRSLLAGRVRESCGAPGDSLTGEGRRGH